MDHVAEADGIALAEPSAPIDPEQAAVTLGTVLAQRHAAATPDGATVDLAAFADAVKAAADAVDDAPMGDGPYLDRSRQDLARIVVDTVAALPPSSEAEVSITPGLSLRHAILRRDGSIDIVGDTAAGDRHLDLARVAVGLAVRYGTAVVAPFLGAYGLDQVDLRRLDTCQLLTAVADDVGVAEPVS